MLKLKKEMWDLNGNSPNGLRDQIGSVGYSLNYFYLGKLVNEIVKCKQVPNMHQWKVINKSNSKQR